MRFPTRNTAGAFALALALVLTPVMAPAIAANNSSVPAQATRSAKVTTTVTTAPEQVLTCSALTVNFHHTLHSGDQINLQLGDGTQPVNAYIDLNGTGYNGLRLVVNGFPDYALTQSEVDSGILVYPYAANLAILSITSFTVAWVQSNETDIDYDLDCTSTTPTPTPEVGIYFYKKLDVTKPAAWENSGPQTFCDSKTGTDWYTNLPCDLPPEICGPGWSYQQDKANDHIAWPASILYPTDNIGWPPLYDAKHGDLSELGVIVPPCTVEQCDVANPDTPVTDLSVMYFEDRLNPSDPNNKGTHALTADGIALTTTGDFTISGQTYYAKSAGYYPVDIPFDELGTPALEYTTTSGADAGLNIAIYKGGVFQFNLTYEPIFAQYWTGHKVADLLAPGGFMPAGPNPSYQLAYGSLDDFLKAFLNSNLDPHNDIRAKAIGYSLGSGAIGTGTVKSLTIGCDKYVFGVPANPGPIYTSANLEDAPDCTVPGDGKVHGWHVNYRANATWDPATANYVYGAFYEINRTPTSRAATLVECPLIVLANPPAVTPDPPTCSANGSLPTLAGGLHYTTTGYDRADTGPAKYTAGWKTDKGYTFATGLTWTQDVNYDSMLAATSVACLPALAYTGLALQYTPIVLLLLSIPVGIVLLVVGTLVLRRRNRLGVIA